MLGETEIHAIDVQLGETKNTCITLTWVTFLKKDMRQSFTAVWSTSAPPSKMR